MPVTNFPAFAEQVARQFQELARQPHVFVVNLDPDALWAEYLRAFPEGTDPVFKKRTEHDCSCCRQFVRRAGAVVALGESGEVYTVWDRACKDAPYPYCDVAQRLGDLVRGAAVCDLFRVDEREGSFGAAVTRSLDEAGDVATWEHFHTGEIPRNLRAKSPDQERGKHRENVQLLERALTELGQGAVSTVLELVDSNSLYRGEEHRANLLEFQKAQRAWASRDQRGRQAYAWLNAGNMAASRFRNTAIGSLVVAISEGQDLEHAVRSFETKVAPTNYKRTTAVITPGMVKKAMAMIAELGLEPALERRFATIADISVNDVKWVDGAAKPLMKGGIGDALMQHAQASKPKGAEDEKRAETIALDEFVARVLPETTGMELLFKGEHLGNLVSLTAPVHPEPRQLFRWSNDFAWSYGGNVADSIKERVKRAGGQVENNQLRVSLSWFNFDDLDLHIKEPLPRAATRQNYYGTRGNEIFYGNKQGWTGGVLDVDMNAGGPRSREAVENVRWPASMPSGAYKVVVNNFCRRETADPGFVVEVENCGKLSHFSYNKGVGNGADVHVCTLHVEDGRVVRVEPGDDAVTAQNVSQEKWGLKTEQWARVSAVTLSPNYWGDNAVGNRHTIFVLEGARNDEPTRGFYNEFLHPRLEPHRKVFEVIGDKTKCQPTDNQLSGLGFSSTKPDHFIVRTQQGKRQRVYDVRVGA